MSDRKHETSSVAIGGVSGLLRPGNCEFSNNVFQSMVPGLTMFLLSHSTIKHLACQLATKRTEQTSPTRTIVQISANVPTMSSQGTLAVSIHGEHLGLDIAGGGKPRPRALAGRPTRTAFINSSNMVSSCSNSGGGHGANFRITSSLS